jgi:putative endonuclease
MREPTYWFYVLYSLKDHKLYKGTCADVGARYLSHCCGAAPSTRFRRPLVLIFVKEFHLKSDALAYERYCKTIHGGVELREILKAMNILSETGHLSSVG